MLWLDTSHPKLVYCSCMAGDLRIASHSQVQPDITPSIVGCDCRAGLSVVDRIVDLHHLDNHKRAESPSEPTPADFRHVKDVLATLGFRSDVQGRLIRSLAPLHAGIQSSRAKSLISYTFVPVEQCMILREF